VRVNKGLNIKLKFGMGNKPIPDSQIEHAMKGDEVKDGN
jgi:hypothetical protein